MEKNDQQQIEVLARRIVSEGYDFIALQEVNQRLDTPLAKVDHYFQTTDNQQQIHSDNFLFCLIQRLSELNCFYYWSWAFNHIGYDIYHEGIGLLSKTPMEVSDHLLSESSDPKDYHTRRAIIGKTTVAHQQLTVVSSHFSWWQTSETSFAFEWRTLERLLLETTGKLIVMGDFNSEAEKKGEGYELVAESPLRLKDSFLVAKSKTGEATVEEAIDGWDGNSAKLRIDFIWVSELFNVEKYVVVFDGKTDDTISDHYGIEAAVD